jgi:[acyl-carrier-protein] S-malonyltransferase
VTDPEGLRSSLGSQICASVLWEDAVRTMVALGVTKFLEFGPGKVLAGLVKKTVETAETESYE